MEELKEIEWTPELVAKFWNQVSKTRLNEYSFSKQAGKSLIIAIKHLLNSSDKILDFGAGDGYLIKLLCELQFKVAGYEPSVIRQGNLNLCLDGISGFSGFVGLESSEKFDVVIMAEVIEHILDADLDATLSRLSNFTKNHGYLIVTTPNNEDLELGMAYCPISDKLFHRWQHVRSFSANSLAELLYRYGFQELATHEVEFSNHLYTPGDKIWGNGGKIPSHVLQIRDNIKTRNAGEKNLLYIGKKMA